MKYQWPNLQQAMQVKVYKSASLLLVLTTVLLITVQTSTTPHRSSASDVPSSPSSKPRIPPDFGLESRRMEMHGLFYDPKALEKYPEFHNMVLEIVNGGRYSEMKQRSVGLFQCHSHFAENLNEATFLESLLPLMIKEDRTVKLEQNDPGGAPLELAGHGDGVMQNSQPDHVYGSRDWFNDGVFAVSLQEFREDLLPHLDEHLADEHVLRRSLTCPRYENEIPWSKSSHPYGSISM